jgi:hypothetical protein
MNQVEAREALLAQHARLRALLRQTADVLVQHAAPGDALEEQVHLVRQAFDEHNHIEERVLRPLLAASGQWGQVRVDHMLREHVAEHAAFDAFLACPIDQIGEGLPEFLAQVEAHICAEEDIFLNAAILRAG